jgi:hypothetical protein
MDKEVKKDIISVLTQALFLIKKEDFIALKELSDHVIHDASIFQDKESTQIAVVTYSLAKILERAKEKGQTISINVNTTLERALNYLMQGDESAYHNEIKRIFEEISKRDEKLLMYINSVIEKANIVKGSKIYGHGISIGRTAELLGLNQWELMSFVGKTRIADTEDSITDISKRMSFTKKLFRIL